LDLLIHSRIEEADRGVDLHTKQAWILLAFEYILGGVDPSDVFICLHNGLSVNVEDRYDRDFLACSHPLKDSGNGCINRSVRLSPF
jgi:hypothetical protein